MTEPPQRTDAAGRADRHVLELVRRHGWNATSYQIMQPGFVHFFVGEDACVGYVDTGRAWVAAGAPLCAPGRFAEVVTAFVAAAAKQGRRACFFGTEDRFATAVPLRSLLIGEQGVWDPALWTATLGRTRSLREQLRRARSKGVRVRLATADELSGRTSPMAAAVNELMRSWLATHEMPAMGFLVDVDPLAAPGDHRLYLAEVHPSRPGGHAGPVSAPAAYPGTPPDSGRHETAGAPVRLVGLLAAAPIFARRGWLLQAVVRAPDAPNGTSELLVDEAMRAAAREDDTLVTLGLAPLAGEVAPPLRWARAAGGALFDFQGLRSFKAKLRPLRWDAVYLSYPRGQGVLPSLLDVLNAFARGRLLRFGLRTLFRGPAIVVRLLTLALIPWTVALAAADSATWFPSPAVKWAWVAFDVLLFFGLAALWGGRLWRHWLAGLVLLAVGVDAGVTAVEALTWNIWRISGATQAAAVLVAVVAPFLALVVLWRARARRF